MLATAAAVALLLSSTRATAVDPGEATVLSPQTVRRALVLDRSKQVRLEADRPMASVKAELTVTQNFPLLFGTLCDQSGSVLVGFDGTVQDDQGNLFFGGTTQAAEFALTGDANRNVSVDFSAPAIGGFEITEFVTNYGAPPLSLTLDGSGFLRLDVGGRLSLDETMVAPGADQSVGYTITTVYE